MEGLDAGEEAGVVLGAPRLRGGAGLGHEGRIGRRQGVEAAREDVPHVDPSQKAAYQTIPAATLSSPCRKPGLSGPRFLGARWPKICL
jgi:hypothetical protein